MRYPLRDLSSVSTKLGGGSTAEAHPWPICIRRVMTTSHCQDAQQSIDRHKCSELTDQISPRRRILVLCRHLAMTASPLSQYLSANIAQIAKLLTGLVLLLLTKVSENHLRPRLLLSNNCRKFMLV